MLQQCCSVRFAVVRRTSPTVDPYQRQTSMLQHACWYCSNNGCQTKRTNERSAALRALRSSAVHDCTVQPAVHCAASRTPLLATSRHFSPLLAASRRRRSGAPLARHDAIRHGAPGAPLGARVRRRKGARHDKQPARRRLKPRGSRLKPRGLRLTAQAARLGRLGRLEMTSHQQTRRAAPLRSTNALSAHPHAPSAVCGGEGAPARRCCACRGERM
jgi:hypothetical protein